MPQSNAAFPTYPILLVDDEEEFLWSAKLTFQSEGMNHVYTCQDSRKVMDLLRAKKHSVVVLDMSMPHINGRELLGKINDEFPQIPVVIITAINDVVTAVESMKAGAFEYILKPVDDARLTTSLRRAIELREVRSENTRLKQYLLRDTLEHPQAFEHIVTDNGSMKAIFKYIEAIAGTTLPVLITGETGTGKELIAHAIHTVSGRKGELVTLDVAGVDDTLFSDTLFGHKKGAYTGADSERKGLIEQASGGTLFLDEIGDLSIESQVKLLRLLQEGKYYPLGSDVPKLSDARVIVATHRNIEHMQEKNEFRRDLYYRLQAHHIQIPSLKERKEDIPLLTEHLLEKAASMLHKKKPTVPPQLFSLLKTYSFPGNIRELEGMIFDAVSRHDSGVLSMETFRTKIALKLGVEIQQEPVKKQTPERLVQFSERLPTLREMDELLIEEALKRAEGNQSIAAQLLGISRRALNNRIIRND